MNRFALTLAACFAPALASADCIDTAAEEHGVNSHVLRAIGWHESRLKSKAVSPPNRNGTRDFGAFQINTAVLASYGLTTADVMDGCKAAQVAAKHLRRQMNDYGNTWKAVGAYHSRTPARSTWYANQIQGVLKGWQLLPKDTPQVPGPMAAPNQPNARREMTP